jgi:hypothetical protein
MIEDGVRDPVAPRRDGRGDRILRPAREPTTEPVTVTTTMQPGPGPSTIDVPGPECWTFGLRWGAHQDNLVGALRRRMRIRRRRPPPGTGPARPA